MGVAVGMLGKQLATGGVMEEAKSSSDAGCLAKTDGALDSEIDDGLGSSGLWCRGDTAPPARSSDR